MAVALAPKWSAKQFAGLAEIEDQVLRQTNDERRRCNLGAVVAVDTLRTAARQHSGEMGADKYFSHESPEDAWRMPWQRAYNAGYWNQQVGENIISVENVGTTSAKEIAAQFMKLWMKSTTHRANILNANWTQLGVGVVKVGDTYFGTQLFGTPLVTLEGALVTKFSGDMVRLQIDGTLRSGVINVWVDETHAETVAPRRGAFCVTITRPRKSGSYAIMVGVGKQVAWEAKLDTDKAPKEMLDGVKVYRAGVVTNTGVTTAAFNGLRLTGFIRFPAGQQAYFIRDDDIIDTLTANKDGLAAFDCILTRRETHYVIGFGYKNLREDLIYIDTTAPLAEAFLGRPAQ